MGVSYAFKEFAHCIGTHMHTRSPKAMRSLSHNTHICEPHERARAGMVAERTKHCYFYVVVVFGFSFRYENYGVK